jgi:hypothetical protein
MVRNNVLANHQVPYDGGRKHLMSLHTVRNCGGDYASSDSIITRPM